MNVGELATVSLNCGIATPDGGYSSCLVGYLGESISAHEPLPWNANILAKRDGFILEANGAPVLIYNDALAGMCPCIVPPSEVCDLRKFNFEHARDNLVALEEVAKYLREEDALLAEDGSHDGTQHEG